VNEQKTRVVLYYFRTFSFIQIASVEAGLQLETSPGDNPALTVRTLKSMNRKFSGVRYKNY